MDNYREVLIALRNGNSTPKNGNEYWSDYDRHRLKTMFEQGIGISELSLELGRTEVGVYSQLQQMNMFSYQCKQRGQGKRSPSVKCLCSNCECIDCPNYGNKEKCKRNV